MSKVNPVVLPDGNLFFNSPHGPTIESQIKETFDQSYQHYYLKYFKLKKNMTVLDIGASNGMWALRVARRVNPGRVITVEPLTENYETLLNNIAINNITNIVPLQAAVWKTNGKVNFIPGCAADVGFVAKDSSKGLPCNSITLDTLMERCEIKKADLLKVDVEGGECEALKGLSDIKNKVGFAVIETHNTLPNILQYFRERKMFNIRIERIPNHDQNQIVHVRIGGS